MQNKIFVVQRSQRMSLPMKWEFPGGKIELNIQIEVVERLTPSLFSYPTFNIELIPFTANYLSGDLKLKVHLQYLLMDKEELGALDWAEADLSIMHEVMKL